MVQFIAALLMGQVQIISEPTATPTLAAAECQCQSGEPCTCGPDCRCELLVVKANKPVISVVKLPAVERPLRIDNHSPITLAPDPDDINTHPDLIAFKERHKNLGIGAPAAVAKTYAAPSVRAKPPAFVPQPVDRAAMVRVYTGTVCVGGRCEARYEWRPVASQPTRSVPQSSRPRLRFRA
jgi:hypothetical protein